MTENVEPEGELYQAEVEEPDSFPVQPEPAVGAHANYPVYDGVLTPLPTGPLQQPAPPPQPPPSSNECNQPSPLPPTKYYKRMPATLIEMPATGTTIIAQPYVPPSTSGQSTTPNGTQGQAAVPPTNPPTNAAQPYSVPLPNNGSLNRRQFKSEVCKDYFRGKCQRKNCKYIHSHDQLNIKNVQFCHDHQNRGCSRNVCSYVHCTKEEEASFKTTNTASQTIINQLTQKPICQFVCKEKCVYDDCCYLHGDIENENGETAGSADPAATTASNGYDNPPPPDFSRPPPFVHSKPPPLAPNSTPQINPPLPANLSIQPPPPPPPSSPLQTVKHLTQPVVPSYSEISPALPPNIAPHVHPSSVEVKPNYSTPPPFTLMGAISVSEGPIKRGWSHSNVINNLNSRTNQSKLETEVANPALARYGNMGLCAVSYEPEIKKSKQSNNNENDRRGVTMKDVEAYVNSMLEPIKKEVKNTQDLLKDLAVIVISKISTPKDTNIPNGFLSNQNGNAQNNPLFFNMQSMLQNSGLMADLNGVSEIAKILQQFHQPQPQQQIQFSSSDYLKTIIHQLSCNYNQSQISGHNNFPFQQQQTMQSPVMNTGSMPVPNSSVQSQMIPGPEYRFVWQILAAIKPFANTASQSDSTTPRMIMDLPEPSNVAAEIEHIKSDGNK